MDLFWQQFDKISAFLWDPFLLLALGGAGVFCTLRFGFVQLRGFFPACRQVFHGAFSQKASQDGMSSFSALMTAVAAQVGTGNLAGAAAAIAVGGPGAVFWMWVSAFFGMATAFGEAVLAQKFRRRVDGTITGGPVYYIKAAFPGLGGRLLAAIFAFLVVFSMGFVGAMVQSNAIGESFQAAFGIPPLYTGIAVALLCFVSFSGGIRRLAALTGRLVPVMALFYMLGSAFVLFRFRENLLPALSSIFVGAFAPQALAGGVVGVTAKKVMRLGLARGLFSHEAGVGSTPHAHAVARVEHPVQQGYVAMLGVFIDTFVILTLTALVILVTGVLTPDASLTGAALTQAGFSAVLGKWGGPFIALCIFFFAFSSLLGWYFFGAANARYLFGKLGIAPYRLGVCLCVFLGALMDVGKMWELADLCCGLMALPNLAALLALSGLSASLLHEYRRR